ncbi:ABC transporter substrate-binding protein [Sphaerisporangium siamense]|uniref:Peptide/nickel transport system substrate-binding protein n=1 Tax=Sphaerisporangium siamense TaxID=795645 RepID=A0A7W7DCU3_9ACTN|nr:ABC transporter substrate-binding protein [Sphaerisporangium siamense]MBB4704489.1 peptide/nickel transport system substrate-binding protein [Sphaerisporangium siamense]GII86099.1 ABC transporter substrate-binding protein [Sphaerisporangium siamense]
MTDRHTTPVPGTVPAPVSGPTFSRRRFLAASGVLTAGAFPLAACGGEPGGTSASGAPSTGGAKALDTLAFGVASISDYLNPLSTTSSRVHWITDPVVEPLYTYDASLKSVPLLADGEPEISEDGLTWTVKLKKGVTFHNGDPFTAEHVAATLAFVTDPKSTSDWTAYFVGYVAKVTAPGDHTVKIKLTTPFGVLRSHLTNLPIVHKDFVKRTDTTLGTGPFKVDKVTQGQQVTLTGHDAYHGTKPTLRGVAFQAVPDPATRLVNLREGKIQIMTGVSPESAGLLKQDDKIRVHEIDAPSDIVTYFQAAKGPFTDAKVRQALGHAMDRKGVRDVVYAGTASIAQGPIGPATEGHDPSIRLYAETPDAAKAKALLAEAGVSSLSFTLTITNDPVMKNIGQVLAEGWKQAGITCTLEVLDIGPWVKKWASGEYQMAMTGFESGFGSGRTAFTLLGQMSSRNPLNFGYKNAEVDRLLGEAWAATDEAARAEACKKIGKLLADDAILLPPVYPKMIVAQRADLSALDETLMSVSRVALPPLRSA